MKPRIWVAMVLLAAAVVVAMPALFQKTAAAQRGVPKFEPDPYWPKPLPNNWMIGQVSGV